MAFEFSQGPHRTAKSREQIGAVIKEVGQERRFMGLARRAGTRLNAVHGAGEYGPFAPSANDDPFSSAGRKPDWQVGWRWGTVITNSMGMKMNQGWQVIFDVFDHGHGREVVAKVQGLSQRREVARFVDSVFKLL